MHRGDAVAESGDRGEALLDRQAGPLRLRGAGAVVVAKGFRTVVAEPGGAAWIIASGDAGLASGGSGDVLTGLIGAFLAQGLEPVRATLLGCWLHGRAGELGGEAYPAAVPASVLPELVARAWRQLADG